jgi:UDPglucose 6-dehydrogenase/GDP-mannose 6-dehydrogenase
MKISVIGAGYVGLVSGVCLAEMGHHVVCVDADAAKVSQIQRGESPIFENGLEPLLRKHIGGRLQATTDLPHAVAGSELSIIAVGTPFSGQEIDLRFVKQVSAQVGEGLRAKKDFHVVVIKSTVVPGTTEQTVVPILEKSSGKKAGVDFGVGVNPEFLTEGLAVRDFMNPDRIVLGAIDARTLAALEALYSNFSHAPIVKTNPRTAEMIKYASNALLATMISFSNEIANLGAAIGGIDTVDVMRGVHLSNYLTVSMPDGSRINPDIVNFLAAGCGFGGSCLPKDVKALIAHGQKMGQPMSLLDAVLQTNERQPHQVIAILKRHFPSLRSVRVTVLGLSFRPDTDDMRESPAIPILRSLAAEGAALKAYDPAVTQEAREIFHGEPILICENLKQAIDDAQAIVLVTRWDEFRRLPELLKARASQPVFIDGRRMLEKSAFARYDGIGL